MYYPPLTREVRDELLARSAKALAEYGDALLAKDRGRARALDATSKAALAEYYDRLPVVPMSCCPYTGQPLYRSFDPLGFDGVWWKATARRPGPKPPRWFCVLRGAVALLEDPPAATPFESLVGPEVPYVIPRILEMEGMIAVLGEMTMETGHRIYTIGYFGKPRPPVQDLTCDWPAKIFEWVTALGESGWAPPVDPWDFDLAPWIEKGKIRWCAPGSNNERLAPAGPPEECPYLDLPGLRRCLALTPSGLLDRGTPSPEP